MLTHMWTLWKVEITGAGDATELAGGALLLGAGVRAYASTPDHEAILTISVWDGKFVCTGVDVSPAAWNPVTAVTPAVLRSIPISRLVRNAFVGLDDTDWRPQRATTPTDRLDAVVATWKVIQGGRDAHRATTATAEALYLSRGHVSRLLSRARDQGLIPR